MSPATRRIGRKLGISLLSLVVVVGGAELVCRMAGYAPSSDYFRWLADPDLQAIPMPNQETWFGRDDPETGQTKLPVRINGYGQRGADYPLPKAAGERRIVVLGDSLTFGQGVLDDEAYPAVLSELLADDSVRVVNSGVNGWATWHYMRWAETRMQHFDPDVLVVGLFLGNDMVPPKQVAAAIPVPLENTLRDSALYQFIVETYRKTLWKRVEATKRGLTLEELDEDLEQYMGVTGSTLPPAEQALLWERVSVPHLERVRALCAEQEVELVLLLIPNAAMAFAEGEPEAHAFLRERLGEMGIATVTCLEALRAVGESVWLPWDLGHFSPEGNRVAAGELARELTD